MYIIAVISTPSPGFLDLGAGVWQPPLPKPPCPPRGVPGTALGAAAVPGSERPSWRGLQAGLAIVGREPAGAEAAVLQPAGSQTRSKVLPS